MNKSNIFIPVQNRVNENLSGIYQREGQKLKNEENELIIGKKGQNTLFLLKIEPNGKRTYLSRLFQHKQNLYRADFKGLDYWVTLTDRKVLIGLRGAGNVH